MQVVYHSWAPGHPVMYTQQRCGKLYAMKSYWYENACSSHMPYVCQEFNCTCAGETTITTTTATTATAAATTTTNETTNTVDIKLTQQTKIVLL